MKINLPSILVNGIPTWMQTNKSDLAGDLWATFNIDLAENEGRMRLGKKFLLNTGTNDVAAITSYPCAFNVCGSNAFAFAGASNVGFAFSNDGTMIGTFAKDTTVGFGTTTYTGSGLNDATYGGAENTAVAHTYIVEITATGTPDTFKWNVDGGSFTTGVAITGAAQALTNGVTITFGATTGHTVGNKWTVTTKVPPYTIDSTKSDSVFSNNAMYVTCRDPDATGFVAFYKKVGNGAFTKTTTTEAADTSYTNMLGSFAGRTYMTSAQSKVISWDSADTVAYSGTGTILLDVVGNFSKVITKILPADDRIFLLTLNSTGGKGHVFEWDGAAQQADYDHRLESSGALSGVMFEGTPYIMDTNGVLLVWNGGTFKEVARLNRKNNLPLYNSLSLVNNRFIHPNGMDVTPERKIQILIDNRNYDNGSTIEETIPSGIYEFDPENPIKGLIHKGPIASNKSGDTINDYGQIRINGAGALRSMGLQSTASGANGTMYAGAGYYTDATTTKYGIFYDDRNDTKQKAGYIITTKCESDEVTETWQKTYLKYKKLLNSSDKIVVKYRTTETDPTEATITWVDTDTFTTTTNVAAYIEGDEIEIIQGPGSGRCAHITSISENAGTYTVNLDETFTGVGTSTAKARFNKWIKLGSISDQTSAFKHFEFPTGAKSESTWIQLKIWMLFTGKDELEKIQIISATSQPLA